MATTPELIAATRVNWVYTGTFLKRPRSGSSRRLYSDLSCHIKDCQNGIYLFEFPEKKKKKKNCIHSVHMHTEPKDPYRNGSVRIRVPLHP